MDILDKAIILAVNAHSGALRKGTKIPYIVHPLEAATIAASITLDREIIAAAVLHDVVEDTNLTQEDIIKEFGERVAKLVMSDSEDKMKHIPPSQSWQSRKQATLDFLDNSTKEEQIICISDKLSNLRALQRDYKKIGDNLWDRFNQKDKSKHAWYYCGIAARLNLIKDTDSYKEYCELLKGIFI